MFHFGEAGRNEIRSQPTRRRNVGHIRREKGLTQEQLAEVSGFSQQYISGLEQGRRNPTVVTLYELATALGVGHLDLLRPSQEE
jgi:transcriptional regulator with XRE-family HTH domain